MFLAWYVPCMGDSLHSSASSAQQSTPLNLATMHPPWFLIWCHNVSHLMYNKNIALLESHFTLCWRTDVCSFSYCYVQFLWDWIIFVFLIYIYWVGIIYIVLANISWACTYHPSPTIVPSIRSPESKVPSPFFTLFFFILFSEFLLCLFTYWVFYTTVNCWYIYICIVWREGDSN